MKNNKQPPTPKKKEKKKITLGSLNNEMRGKPISIKKSLIMKTKYCILMLATVYHFKY